MKNAVIKSSNEARPAFGMFIKSIERYGFGDPVTPFCKASESFAKCEKLHRKANRAKALGLPKADYYEEMAMLHNRHGLRKLGKAKESVMKAIKMYRDLKIECDMLSEKEKNEILGDLDILFKDSIFEADLESEEAKEIWMEYGNIRTIINDKGIRGLLGHLGSKLDELIDARLDLKKGRKPTSPYPLAFFLELAIILGVSVIAAIDCYNKHGCQWMLSMSGGPGVLCFNFPWLPGCPIELQGVQWH